MACSHCGGNDHNVQRCPTVRRCGHCSRPGHDRRNCPKLEAAAPVAPTKAVAPAVAAIPAASTWEQIAKLCEFCAAEPDLLAHLYFPDRLDYFEQSRRAYSEGGPWRLKATPHHGVHKPERPTLNFFAVDGAWVEAYAAAAESRDIRHGVLIRRASIKAFAELPDYVYTKVEVGYPTKFGVVDRAEFWRFDLGNHRFKALDVMRLSTVVRLATPVEESARYVDIPARDVVTWW